MDLQILGQILSLALENGKSTFDVMGSEALKTKQNKKPKQLDFRVCQNTSISFHYGIGVNVLKCFVDLAVPF